MKAAVKHIISKELTLYFEKIQAALLDDTPDPEVQRLREAALESVSNDPGIHQLVPYFVSFISHEVTHHIDDVFVLRQMMELTGALIVNPHVFLEPYATPLSVPVLTCLMGRKLGPGDGTDAIQEQYRLRELAASLIGQIAKKYSSSNKLLRPKLVRSCLKHFMDPTNPPAVWYGAISGVLAAGGPEAVRVLVLPNLKDFDASLLGPLCEKGGDATEFEVLVGAILKAVKSLSGDEEDQPMQNGVNGDGDVSERETREIKTFVGDIVGERIVRLGDKRLNLAVLEARSFQ